MLFLFALAVVVSAPLLAEEAVPSATSVAVIMDFDGEPSAVSLEEMKREFEAVMIPSGLNFDWRILNDAVTREYFTHLVVARFRGDCRARSSGEEEAESGALGLTHVSDGDVLPFTEVDCDRVRRLIHGELSAESFPRMERLLGRALGRVLAHEIYHMLADTRKHGGGVTRPVLAPHDLVAGRLPLEEPQARLIRKRFRPAGKEALAHANPAPTAAPRQAPQSPGTSRTAARTSRSFAPSPGPTPPR